MGVEVRCNLDRRNSLCSNLGLSTTKFQRSKHSANSETGSEDVCVKLLSVDGVTHLLYDAGTYWIASRIYMSKRDRGFGTPPIILG